MKYDVVKIENGKKAVLLAGTTKEKADECISLAWKICARSPKRYRVTQRDANRITFIQFESGGRETETTYEIQKCKTTKK